jgi:hypothetical protein
MFLAVSSMNRIDAPALLAGIIDIAIIAGGMRP